MRTILLTVLLVVAATAQATDYYVAPYGDDHAAGTKGAPLRTIMRAQQAAKPATRFTFAAASIPTQQASTAALPVQTP